MFQKRRRIKKPWASVNLRKTGHCPVCLLSNADPRGFWPRSSWARRGKSALYARWGCEPSGYPIRRGAQGGRQQLFSVPPLARPPRWKSKAIPATPFIHAPNSRLSTSLWRLVVFLPGVGMRKRKNWCSKLKRLSWVSASFPFNIGSHRCRQPELFWPGHISGKQVCYCHRRHTVSAPVKSGQPCVRRLSG